MADKTMRLILDGLIFMLAGALGVLLYLHIAQAIPIY